SSGVSAGNVGGDAVERKSPVHDGDAVHDRVYFAVYCGRAFRDISGAARSGKGGGQRRLCDRALSFGDGRGGDVCDTGGAVFLVPEAVWLPDERETREGAFLDDVCGRLLHLYANALAGAAEANESSARCQTRRPGVGWRLDSKAGHGGDHLDGGGV